MTVGESAPAAAADEDPDSLARARGLRVHLRTYGCQMNVYDSQKIVDSFVALGGEAVADPAQADVVLFNTCSVREKAQEKVFTDLGRARLLKRENPDLLVGVGGCVASQEGGEIARRAPFVDLVFGPQTLHRLPQMVARRRAGAPPQIDVSFPEIEKFDNLPPPSQSTPTAFVSVMEGCSKYCSFCVVPYTRGEEVSRPLDSTLAEVAAVAAKGAREVTLLGQNVNAYRAVDPRNGAVADFADLLECVSQIDGIERIRFTTSHPLEFGDRLIEAFARLPTLADHVHLPAQSGADRVLARMKRGYTALEYKSIVRKLRRARPGVSISSDFIIGFPGESDDDFERTIALVEDVGFDFSFSFLFSARPGTPAARLPDETPLAVKKERLARLQALLESSGRAVSQSMIGSRQRVLVESESKRKRARADGLPDLRGRASNNRMIHFYAPRETIGDFAEVRVEAANPHTLRGVVAPPSARA